MVLPDFTQRRKDAKLPCLIILCVALGSCARVETKASDTPAAAVTVAVAKAAREDLARDLILTAEFRPFQEVDVMAKVAGYVKIIQVDVGDRVKQGQVLAILEIPEMADCTVWSGDPVGDVAQRQSSPHFA